jgi:hypothetical protein
VLTDRVENPVAPGMGCQRYTSLHYAPREMRVIGLGNQLEDALTNANDHDRSTDTLYSAE